MNSLDKSTIICENVPNNLTIETIMMILDRNDPKEVFPKEKFHQRLRSKISQHPRFRSRVDAERFLFIEKENFDPASHVFYHTLKFKTIDEEEEEEGDDGDINLFNEELLREFFSFYQNSPFRAGEPLWDIIIVENYPKGYALFWRIHHGSIVEKIHIKESESKSKSNSTNHKT